MATIQHADVISVHRMAHVGTSDPGAVGAYKGWVDTNFTPYRLKVRNAANTDWTDVGIWSSAINNLAALTPSEGDFLEYKTGGWVTRTPIQVKTDLALNLVPNIDTRSRANHTGTQLASTISDFTTSIVSTWVSGITDDQLKDRLAVLTYASLSFANNGLILQGINSRLFINNTYPGLGDDVILNLFLLNSPSTLTVISDASIAGANTGDRTHNPLVVSVASTTSPTPNVDLADMYVITALAGNPTFGAPTGTVANGKLLTIRITSNGSSHTIIWNAAYKPMSAVLPATIAANKTIYVDFRYSTTSSKWECVNTTIEI